MKTIAFTLVFAVTFICSSLYSQRIMKGVVTIANQPVENIKVYTSFGTSKTDDLGRYALQLDGCSNCQVGDKIDIFTFSAEYGSTKQTYTISNDYIFNFSISRNSPNFFVSGIVKTSGSDGTPLANMEVKVIGLEYNIEAVKTNDFGEFTIPIRRDILSSDANAVRLQVIDPQKKFRSVYTDPELYAINSFATILMEPSLAYHVDVSGFTHTKICVNSGDAVSISASGQIRVGANVGNSDPDGRTSGVFGFALEAYNIVREYNHAALMYRFEGETEWKLAGKLVKFIAPHSGCLEFQVNDNTQEDNIGHYDVEIDIRST